MEIILLGVDDGLLPADDGMPWHVKNQIIFPLTSQSVSYFIFKSNRKIMIQRLAFSQIRSEKVMFVYNLFLQKFTAKYFSSQVSDIM